MEEPVVVEEVEVVPETKVAAEASKGVISKFISSFLNFFKNFLGFFVNIFSTVLGLK